MRAAARGFYLAVFALLGSSHAASHKDSLSSPSPARQDVCGFDSGALVQDACTTYATLEDLNTALHPYLHSITQDTDFFSHYRLNLFNKKCPFWSDENGMCGNVACAVNTLENEEDIPLVWRAHELGKLEGPTARHPGRKVQVERPAKPLQGELGDDVGESCVVEYDDECDERDYCVPEDERASAKGDYVNLVKNPERFTGYAGVGSQQVWQAIYRENCFSKPPKNGQSSSVSSSNPIFGAGPGGRGGFGGGLQQAKAAQDLKNVLKDQAAAQGVRSAIAHNNAPHLSVDPIEFDDTCIEKRVFYRVISGMHASISTHLCWEHLNQTTGKWAPNLACYEQRLHNFPDRISNLYFNYALMLRAISKIKQHVKDYNFCSADLEQDRRTRAMVLNLADRIPRGPSIFDETVMFQDPGTITLKEDFRNRFRNVSRIMDCVGCDKCRLWGKLQVAGYGTALKVLFEFDEKDSSQDPPLRRTELVALINTMDRLSHSLSAVGEFRRMIEERDGLRAPAAVPPKDDESIEETPRKERKQHTLGDEFRAEFGLVWRTFKFIIKGYIELPAKLWNIFIFETARLWAFWLGQPVGPRSWDFKFPTHEEL